MRAPLGDQPDDVERDVQPVPAHGRAQTASSSVWQALPAGADVPDSAQDVAGFAQFMQQTYGSPPAPCADPSTVGLMTGDTVWAPDGVDLDVVVAVPPAGPTPTAQPTRRRSR